MARQNFQGRLRTTCGTPKSVISADTGKPVVTLAQSLYGPIQLSVLNLGAATKVFGMLPANWVIWDIVSIVAPSGGTVAIQLPLYNGNAAVNMVTAAAAPAAGTSYTIAAGRYASYTYPRPISVTGVAATLGQMVIGVMGFPLDDAASELI